MPNVLRILAAHLPRSLEGRTRVPRRQIGRNLGIGLRDAKSNAETVRSTSRIRCWDMDVLLHFWNALVRL